MFKSLFKSLILAACGVGLIAGFARQSRAADAPSSRPAAGPLSENAGKGIHWLISAQLPSGAWGQGEESSQMGNGMDKIKDTPNVADTCMAIMALYRTGSTPRAGEYHEQSLKAVNFVCDQIEAADDKSLSITSLSGTRTQMKLGTYIDTFMAAQALAEIKQQMPDPASVARVDSALKKVVHKIEINQKDNGQWVNAGWAPTLAQAQAAKSINIAAQNGAVVNDSVRLNAQEFARADYQNSSAPGVAMDGGGTAGAGGGGRGVGGAGGGFGGGGGAVTASPAAPVSGPVASSGLDNSHSMSGQATFSSRVAASASAGNAGVPLYSAGGQIAAMQASANTNNLERNHLEQIANSPTTQPADRKVAQDRLRSFDANASDLAAAQRDVVQRMQDPRFASGFGSNGGEEYLSYLNIGESLYQKGGDDWKNWNQTMTANVNHIQNDDGSWSGGHCITGRTFCTAAAVMVLTIDRAPTPVAANLQTTANP